MAAVHLSESDFQTLIAASLYFDSDVEAVREAQAVGPEGGRIDLLIRPVKGSPVKTSYLVEFKHLAKAEGKSEAAIQKALKSALEQTRRYARCSNLRGIPNLKRVAAVYAGTELVRLVQEEGEAGA